MVYVPGRKQRASMAWFLVSWCKFNRVVRASRYKLLSDAVMVPGYRTDKRHWRSFAVEVMAEPDNSHGAGTVGV